MNPIETRIGYKFRNPLLLAEALTHSSLAHETQHLHFDNQRLEFLGDAVLQLVFTDHLYKLFPEASEGDLTKLRTRFVSGEALRGYAERLELGQYLMMGRGDESSGGRRRGSTLADAFEALVGALYLDSNLEVAKNFCLAQSKYRLDELDINSLEVNPKGQLQEILQSLPMDQYPGKGLRNPSYRIVAEEGPAHAKSFRAEVVWLETPLGHGSGMSKQQAEIAAASDALATQSWLKKKE